MKKSSLVSIFFIGSCLLSASGCGAAAGNNNGGGAGPQTVATHFSVTSVASAASGIAIDFTVTALGASNQAVTTYSGTVHFTSTDGQAVLPANSRLTNGTGNFSVTLKTVGSQSVSATDTVTNSITGSTSSINVVAQGSITITSAPPPNGVVGQRYGGDFSITKDHCSANFVGWQPTATGGSGEFQWSWSAAPGSSIPPGLSVSTETYSCGGSTRCCVTVSSPLLVNGSPTAPGTYKVIVTIMDTRSPAGQASATYAIVISSQAPAVSDVTPDSDLAHPHIHYKLMDLGTLGGPNSYLPAFYVFENITPQTFSADGTFAGWADTSDSDPFAPICFFDCFVDRAFKWKDGVRTPLGALPGPAGLSSAVTWISNNGLIAGFSENGENDPFFDAPAFHGVLWQNDKIVDLKTLDGGYESEATAVNSSGQVVGFSSNSTLDPNSIQDLATQTRAFVWQNGVMKDLSTLGGTDAEALYVNERGQVVGQSYAANSVPNPVPHCGDSPLTLHAFIWGNGKMTDLDTLGGSCASAYALNDLGQVVGQSNLTGDEESHPFLWNHGTMTDLHTLGGTYGYAAWLNDTGEIVGAATNQDDHFLFAFYWKDGAMTNLGTVDGDPCSVADAINSVGQVVGGSGITTNGSFPACDSSRVEHAVLWDNGTPLDLNQFVPSSSNMRLNEAVFITDSGEIAGFGTLPNGDQHTFLLIPCAGDQAGTDGCNKSLEDSTAAPVSSALDVPVTATASSHAPVRMLNRLWGGPAQQHRGFGMTQPPVQ